MNKHAYLIAAHTDPEHLKALILALDRPWTRFFIHVDKKVDVSVFQLLDLPPRVTFLRTV